MGVPLGHHPPYTSRWDFFLTKTIQLLGHLHDYGTPHLLLANFPCWWSISYLVHAPPRVPPWPFLLAAPAVRTNRERTQLSWFHKQTIKPTRMRNLATQLRDLTMKTRDSMGYKGIDAWYWWDRIDRIEYDGIDIAAPKSMDKLDTWELWGNYNLAPSWKKTLQYLLGNPYMTVQGGKSPPTGEILMIWASTINKSTNEN